ncbi:GNAT family N-acetyltransferase [Myroides sp. M-43]|uniref:GNAT family N-acetyltransferase n=1 Tax=Myroides oncorhynchi TaxID=2893756 RepID=UPI001E559502|nr:GNAT family N-acetyltransferase [Myroides oncorhynchi]MCC9044423.1 GNAT family N-acetyltransferase [Myroides oncorhynchi]
MPTTDRLILNRITHRDNAFMLELVNTPGWLTFIGDKNIHTTIDAQQYIQNILDNTSCEYWVVSKKEDNKSIGLISIIQREYLEYSDLGFAFLPNQMNKGYAYEATSGLLKALTEGNKYSNLCAITLPDNNNSIKLIQRLGFTFDRIIEAHDETLNLYQLELK